MKYNKGMCYSASSYERIYELEKTFVKVLCNKATESMADLVIQLTPTLSRCSSVGNLIKYANFLAIIKEKLIAKNIMPKKRKRIKCMRTRRTLPLWPIGPSNVTPSTKLGETAASFLPRVIISPKFWNLEIDGQGRDDRCFQNWSSWRKLWTKRVAIQDINNENISNTMLGYCSK